MSDSEPNSGLLHFAIIALFFGLVGDVCLAIPGFFLVGLGAFLAGHIAYTVAFWHYPLDMPVWWILVFCSAAGFYSANIIGAAIDNGKSKYAIPIAMYSTAITLMVLVAYSYGLKNQNDFVLLGSLLFYLSDSVLAWDRFYRPFPGGRVVILITYYAGQFLLAVGVLASTLIHT